MQPARFVIEINGTAAGIVVAERTRYRFFAAGKAYSGLERRLFRSPAEAEAACHQVAIGVLLVEPRLAGRPVAPDTPDEHMHCDPAAIMVGG
jgi:hypothetical protein